MKKSPLDYLLLAARTFLVLAFLGNLVVAAVGYCILPDQIVSRAYPEYEIGLHNPYSKDYFFGFMVGTSFFLFLLVCVLSFVPARKRKNKTGYWNQDENIGLYKKIFDFWYTLGIAGILIQQAKAMIRHFPVNLAVPPRGDAFSFFDLIVTQLIIVAMFAFVPLTLAVVKRFRERRKTTAGMEAYSP